MYNSNNKKIVSVQYSIRNKNHNLSRYKYYYSDIQNLLIKEEIYSRFSNSLEKVTTFEYDKKIGLKKKHSGIYFKETFKILSDLNTIKK
jgi:hypothetical protein